MASVSSFDDPNPPFYPPPEWLSESPARPPIAHPGATPKASPSNPTQPRYTSNGDAWRQTPTGATARQSSRSASATGPVTPAVTHISYPKARLGLFPPTSAGGSIRDHNYNRFSTRTRNTNYSTPNDSQNHQQNGHENSIDRNQLLSPVPPPPANLHTPQNATAFNVDPGVPFLATAGPTEDGSDDGEEREDAYGSNIPASMRPGPGPPRNLVGGLVSGIRSVVRRSTMRRRVQHPGEGVGEYEYQYDPDHDPDPNYDYNLPQQDDAPRTGTETGTRDSGYAPSTPQYDDAPAPTPAQPTPASLYARQILEQGRREEEEQRQREREQEEQQQRERRRGPPPVSPIARDYVRGDHPTPHRVRSQYSQYEHPQSGGHPPAQTNVTPRPRMVVDPGLDEHNDDPEAIPFTHTPPGVPPPRGYSLHDGPVPSPFARPSRLSRPPTLAIDGPPASSKPRPNLLSPENAETPPLPSPVSATPHYAPDYAQMNLPTSAAALAAMGFMGGYSAGGLKVYARKVRRGWEAWRRLPWVVGLDDVDSAEEEGGEHAGSGSRKEKKERIEASRDEEDDWQQRVTWDYYPQRERRRRIGRMGVKRGKGGVWKDEKGPRGSEGANSSHGEDEWDEDSEAAARRARVPAIVWRSPHYRVSLDDAAMPFAHGHPSNEAFENEDGTFDEWHEGAWDSDAHGDPEAGSHYRGGGGRGNESDPDGWMDIRPMGHGRPPLQPRRNVVITPQRRSYADVDLADEFEAVTPAPVVVHTPLPLNPPGAATGPPPPPGSAGPLPMYPPGQGQTPAVPSGPLPYYPPVLSAAAGGSTPAPGATGATGNSPHPSRTRSSNGMTQTSVHEPPPIEPIEDDEPPSARSRVFPPPLLPHPRPPQPHLNTGVRSRGASVSSPIWSRPPPGQPPGTYAPMPPGFEDGASMRRRSTQSHGEQHHDDALPSPARSQHSQARAPSHRSGHSHISAALRPPPGQPPGTYIPLNAYGEGYQPPLEAMQRQGSDAYAPSARSRASQRSRPPPGQPPGTYPPFDDDESHPHAHRREPAYGNAYAYTPSRASSNRSGLPPPPPPPGQPPGSYIPVAQAHLTHTPSHASHRSHVSRTSHASSNPFRPPPGQPPGTYPPFQDEFTVPHGDYDAGGVEDVDEEAEGSYDHYTPTPAPRRTGTAGSGSAPSGGAPSSRSHISTRAHRLLQTPGPTSARSLAAHDLAEASDEEEDENGEAYPEGYVPYNGPDDAEEEEEIDWSYPHSPGGGHGEGVHLTFREALALQERRQRGQ